MAEPPFIKSENDSKVSDSNQPRADLDIFPKLAAFLDPHLIIPVLEFFYRGLGIYEEKAVLEAKLEIAKRLVTRSILVVSYNVCINHV